eukprot:gene14593-19646_t
MPRRGVSLQIVVLAAAGMEAQAEGRTWKQLDDRFWAGGMALFGTDPGECPGAALCYQGSLEDCQDKCAKLEECIGISRYRNVLLGILPEVNRTYQPAWAPDVHQATYLTDGGKTAGFWHSHKDPYQWAKVTFKKWYRISQVRVTNRCDCPDCAEWLTGSRVYIGQSASAGRDVEEQCGDPIPPTALCQDAVLECNIDGDYIVIRNDPSSAYPLNIMEIEAHGVVATTTTTTTTTTTATSVSSATSFPTMGSGFYGFSKFSGHVTCADAATIHVVGSMTAPDGNIWGHFMNAPSGSKPMSSTIATGGILLANQVVWKVEVTTQGWIQLSPYAGIPAHQAPANKTFFVDLQWAVSPDFCTPL